MEIDWNLDPQKITEIPIYQIYFKDTSLENHPDTISLRLLILSHKLALSEIPSFYLDSSLSIRHLNNQNTDLGPNIIIFDIEEKFENEIQNLPFWAHVIQWRWIPHELFQNQIVDAFSRALTLRLYYKHFDLHPLYFTSYILIPGGSSFFEPFLVQSVPVLRQGCLQIRTVLQNGLDCIINPKNPPDVGSFILFPPNEHPLLVKSFEQPNLLTAITISKKLVTINVDTEDLVFLTNPSLIMPKFFEDDKDLSPVSSTSSTVADNHNYSSNINLNANSKIADNDKDNVPFCQFSNIQLFKYSEKDIENYFISKFSNDSPYEFGQVEKENESEGINENENDFRMNSKNNDDFDSNASILEDTLPTARQIITEIIPSTNITERQKILSCVGTIGSFPSKRSNLTCIKANFLSYYRFDFGFSTVNPPSFIKRFGQTSRVNYKRLGIPYIVLNKNGDKYEEKADIALSLWENERFMPISGPKDAHYVVFAMNNVRMDSVNDFMSQFTTVYANCGFGALTPYPRKNSIMSVPVKDIPQTLMEYFDPLTEFQQYPVITFIVAPPIFNASFKPHSIVNYIRPSALDTATLEEVKTLAFVVYSRIRIFAPQPTGMVEPLLQQEVGVVLFGFRYQPPFLLSKNANSNDNEIGLGLGSSSHDNNDDHMMEMHVAWDPNTSLSVWIDGIGSILHFLPAKHVMSMSKFIEKAKEVFKVKVKFTVTILGEGISSQLYNECNNDLPHDVEIYSVSPSPAVNAHFSEDFADDVVIFERPEQCFEVPKRSQLSSSNSSVSFNTQHQQHLSNSNDIVNDFDNFDGFGSFDVFDDFKPNYGHSNSNMNLNTNHQASTVINDNDEDHYVEPSATCYVMSKFQPPYMVSIYRNGNKQQLLNYVTKVSHLSWLSVKPGDEKRTISYPPHICALLRKNDCSCLTISRFEFLPSQEKI